MKYNKPILLTIALLSISLASCDSKTSTSSSNSSFSFSSTNQTSSSLSSTTTTNKFIEELNKLKKGYAFDGLFKAEFDNLKIQENLVEISANDDYYKFHEFEGVEYGINEERIIPNKNKASYTFNYSHDIYEPTNEDLTYNSRYTFNNEIEKEIVLPSTDTPLIWETSGFKNAFSLVDENTFVKENENTYVYENTNSDEFAKYISTQIYGGGELTTSIVTLKMESDELSEIYVEFDKVVDSATNKEVIYTFNGTITSLGESSCGPLLPLTGTKYEELNEVINSLKLGNYHSKSIVKSESFGNSEYEGYLEKEKKYFVYTTKNDEASYEDAYFEKDNVLHSATKINNDFYEDRIPFDYSLEESKMIPTFNLSPLFFIENKISNNKITYTLDRSYAIKTTLSNLFSPYSTDTIVDLTIEINKVDNVINNVVIKNVSDENNYEEITFDQIGLINNYIEVSNIKNDISELKWSELLPINNSVEELQSIYSVIPQDILDTIPNLGGYTTTIVAETNYFGGIDLIFQKSQTLNEAQTIFDNYISKLEQDSNYTKAIQQEGDTITTFTKPIVVDEVSKYLKLELELVDYSYLGMDAFFIYLSVSIVSSI